MKSTHEALFSFAVALLLMGSGREAPAQDAAMDHTHMHHAAPAESAMVRSEHEYFEPDAMLKDTQGRNVALRPLLEANQPVMIDFIYTSCTAVCPLLTETFAEVQRQLGPDASGLRMVSISIDPEFDTPKVLAAYAQNFHPGAQWRFLTGNPSDIAEIQRAFDAFKANKMDHQAIILIRASKGKPWVRFEGLVSPAVLLAEYRAMPRPAPGSE